MEIIQECRICGYAVDEENDGYQQLCDHCGDKQCTKCVDHIFDYFKDAKGGQSYEEYVVCEECITNIDSDIQDEFDEYINRCEAKDAKPLSFKVWLHTPRRNRLRAIREHFRKRK